MDSSLTEIVVILDRSGSMTSCRADMEGGLRTFVEDQKKQPNRATFTLVQFDNTYEIVHDGVDLASVDPTSIVLVPRGSTALYDAIGRTVNTVGERLAATPEEKRPGLVIVMIVTDGMENASSEFSSPMIVEMVKRQQEEYGWQFVYLGADHDAIAASKGIGVSVHTSSAYSKSNVAGTYGMMTNKVARARTMNASGQCLSGVMDFTEDEKRELEDES